MHNKKKLKKKISPKNWNKQCTGNKIDMLVVKCKNDKSDME